MLRWIEAERPHTVRIAILNGPGERGAHDDLRGDRRVRAVRSDVVQLYREHVLLRGWQQEIGEAVEGEVLIDERLGGIPIGQGIVCRRDRRAHGDTAGDFHAVQVSHETVITFHRQDHVPERVRIGHREVAAQINRRVAGLHGTGLLLHVRQLGTVPSRGAKANLAITNRRRAAQPGGIVIRRVRPGSRGQIVDRGWFGCALEVFPTGTQIEQRGILELHTGVGGRIARRIRIGGRFLRPHLAHRPARETFGQLLDVGLGVTIVHPEREEFENLAGVVLIGRALHVEHVVQIDQLGGAGRTVEQQVAEVPQRVLIEEVMLAIFRVSGFALGLRVRHRIDCV